MEERKIEETIEKIENGFIDAIADKLVDKVTERILEKMKGESEGDGDGDNSKNEMDGMHLCGDAVFPDDDLETDDNGDVDDHTDDGAFVYDSDKFEEDEEEFEKKLLDDRKYTLVDSAFFKDYKKHFSEAYSRGASDTKKTYEKKVDESFEKGVKYGKEAKENEIRNRIEKIYGKSAMQRIFGNRNGYATNKDLIDWFFNF